MTIWVSERGQTYCLTDLPNKTTKKFMWLTRPKSSLHKPTACSLMSGSAHMTGKSFPPQWISNSKVWWICIGFSEMELGTVWGEPRLVFIFSIWVSKNSLCTMSTLPLGNQVIFIFLSLSYLSRSSSHCARDTSASESGYLLIAETASLVSCSA